jgi:hypothetical protein
VTFNIKIAMKKCRDGNYAQCHQEQQSKGIKCKITESTAPVSETGIYCKTGLKYPKNYNQDIVNNAVPVCKNQSCYNKSAYKVDTRHQYTY